MIFSLVAIVCLFTPTAHGQDLQPFKDKLFRHTKVLRNEDKGLVRTFEFIQRRDVNGRDEIPVDKAKAERVDLAVLSAQRDIVVKYKDAQNQEASLETFEVGEGKDAKFAVIFIHGGGGTKLLGANDWTFGGNFNRLKNLAVKNGGVYYSPSVTFDERGAAGVNAIIDRVKAASPEAKIVVACGSAGGYICDQLAADPAAVAKLAGLIPLGSASIPANITQSPAFAASLPIVYAHGTRDPILPFSAVLAQYKELRKANPNYPAQVFLYNRGLHGTPIRMIDWKETLNWIFAQKRKSVPVAKKASPAQQSVPPESSPQTTTPPAGSGI